MRGALGAEHGDKLAALILGIGTLLRLAVGVERAVIVLRTSSALGSA